MASRISVLLPTYNRARFLAESLDSIFSQTLEPYEVIVIDDGSTDETVEIVRRYRDRLRYLSKPNGGKSTALNLGLQHARGDYVWVMDDDNIALPHALERLVAPLEADPSLGMSFSNYLVANTLPDGSLGQPIESPIPSFPDADLFLALVKYGCLTGGAAILVRASVCQDVGQYDDTLVRSQDFEMALRLSAACKAIRISGPTFIYRQHSQLRGSAADRHTDAEKIKRWLLYNKIVYERVLRDTPLQRYLPATQSIPLSNASLRRAHLERMAMLWRGGLFTQLLNDLAEAVKIPGPLSTEERQCFYGGCYPLDEAEGYWDKDYNRSVRRRTSSAVGREIRVFLAQSIYWRARQQLAGGQYRVAWRNVRACLSILGWAGIVSAVNYKLRQLFYSARNSQLRGTADSVDEPTAIQH